MKGYVLAVANMKGGVGKTATVVELSQALAADDPRNRILVIDVDAQASASFAIAGEEVLGALIRDGRTIDAYLEDILIYNRPRTLGDCIRRDVCTVYQGDLTLNISLIASSPPLRTVERGLIHALTRSKYDMERIEKEMCGLIARRTQDAAQSVRLHHLRLLAGHLHSDGSRHSRGRSRDGADHSRLPVHAEPQRLQGQRLEPAGVGRTAVCGVHASCPTSC